MQSDTLQRTSEKNPLHKAKIKILLWFLCGVLWGGVLVFIAGVVFLRHNLILEYPFSGDFTNISESVEPAAAELGWTVSANPCGIPRIIDGQPIEIYRLCKREYAVELLQEESDRKIGCLLPCAISIYRKADGLTYLSRLNMPLVTMLLGGAPVQIFRNKISVEQQVIFSHMKKNEQ